METISSVENVLINSRREDLFFTPAQDELESSNVRKTHNKFRDVHEERKVVTNAKRISSRVRILNRNLIPTGEEGNVHVGKKCQEISRFSPICTNHHENL